MKIRISCLLAIILFLALAVNIYAEEMMAALSETHGKVLVKSPGADWKSAVAGQQIKAKDSLKTEDKSLVTLKLPDGSKVTLKSNSEITLAELTSSETTSKILIDMSIGEIRAVVEKLGPGSEFKIKTPVAVSGVRGTILYKSYNGIDATLFTEDGAVDFNSTVSEEAYTVIKGMISTAYADGRMSEPRTATEEERAMFVGGWEAGLAAEPYTEPAGGEAADVEAPEVREEGAASTI